LKLAAELEESRRGPRARKRRLNGGDRQDRLAHKKNKK
jgi:hypothetical protein